MASQSESLPPEAPVVAPAGRLRRLGRWLAGTAAVERAERRVALHSELQNDRLAKARVAAELGRRILEQPNPPRHGRGFDASATLYRQAAYWALLASSTGTDLPEPNALWDANQSRIGSLGVEPEELARVETTFRAGEVFLEMAELPSREQRAAAELMRGFVERLVEEHDGPRVELARRKFFRVLRTALVAMVLVVVAVLVTYALIPKAPNLAEGKPWTASSKLYDCHPDEADCGGVKTRILFHTREEREPWFQIDLGKPTRFSSMTIRNRTDFGPDRAVPLIVEVSNDGEMYRTIAERVHSFTTWEPKFPEQEARYVRLRVAKKTFLHLEKVEIHP